MAVRANVINVPIELLKDIKWDKGQQELLAFAIAIKMNYEYGALNGVSINFVKNMLQCSFYKAKDILERAKADTRFFRYLPEQNRLETVNFKKAYTKISRNKGGELIWHFYAVKIDVANYSLREMLREFEQLLLLNAVNAVERENKFLSGGRKNSLTNKGCNLSLSEQQLTQKKLANIVGKKNRMSVYRAVKRLEEKKALKVERHPMRLITDCTSDAALANDNNEGKRLIVDKKSGYGYVKSPNEYHCARRSVNDKFCNIILNHSRRCTETVTAKAKSEKSNYIVKSNNNGCIIVKDWIDDVRFSNFL